jgi:hypothetical protein
MNAKKLADFFRSDADPAKTFVDAFDALNQSRTSCIEKWSFADEAADDLWDNASNASDMFDFFVNGEGDLGEFGQWRARHPYLARIVSELSELHEKLPEMHKECMVAEPFRNFDFTPDDVVGAKPINTAILRNEATEGKPMIVQIYASF